MKKSNWMVAIAAVLSLASALQAEDKPKVIRIGNVGSGYGKPYTTGPGALLAAKGWLDTEFKPDGIKIQQNYFVGAGPAINEALANNSLDIASYGDLPAIIGKAAGLKTVVLAGQRGNQIYVVVPAKSPVKSIEELKGKRVGVPKGTYMHLSFDRKIDTLGLKESSFDLINIANANGEQAIASNGLDGFVGTSSAIRLRDLGVARIIYTNKNDPDDWKGQSVLVVQEAFLKKYPETTKRFLKVWLKAVRWEADEANRREALQIDSNTGTPLSYLTEDHAGIAQKVWYNPLFDDVFLNHYKFAVKFSKQHNLIKQEFDVDKWINRELLTQALKEIGWNPQ